MTKVKATQSKENENISETRAYVDAVVNAAMVEGIHGLSREKDAQRFIRKVSGAIMYSGGDEAKIVNDHVIQFIYTCFRNNITLDCRLEKPLL